MRNTSKIRRPSETETQWQDPNIMTGRFESVPYSPLPSDSHPPTQNVVVILPSYRRRLTGRSDRRCLFYSVALSFFLLVAAATFVLYPSDPAIRVARIHLNHAKIKTSPKLVLDLSFFLTVKVRNRNFFSLAYDSLDVSVGYRGRELGIASSDGGRLRARGSSYMNVTLNVDGFQVIHDVIYLLEDLAKGVIPFDTDTRVKGELGLLFFSLPFKATVSCQVYVNTDNQTINRQDCNPESWG